MNPVNELIEDMKRFLDPPGRVIPLDDFHSNDWIEHGLMSPEFRDYFRAHPFGETDLYTWNTTKVDEIRNLRIYRRQVR